MNEFDISRETIKKLAVMIADRICEGLLLSKKKTSRKKFKRIMLLRRREKIR